MSGPALLSYRAGGSWRAAVRVGGVTVDAELAAARAGLPKTSGDFSTARGTLAAGDDALWRLADAAPSVPPLPSEIAIGPPVPDPGKIVCVGLNYRDHIEETGAELPDTPVLFAKFSSCLTGPGAPIRLPAISDQVDYEVELAVVIGKVAKAVSAEDALSHVGGYTVMNDVSARDLQFRTSQWLAGKALDTFAPCGPVLITREAVPDPQALRLSTRVNGELLQDSSTASMVFGVAELVSFISGLMTLEPGDLIATGTPAGVGFTRSPPRFLRPGDVVETAVESIGTLRNPVVASEARDG